MNLTLNYYLLLLFATFNLILAIVVHFNNEKNKVATWFSLILGGTTLWIFTNAMTLRATDVESGIFWSQISYFSAVIIAAAFFYFSLVFPDITSRKIDRYIPKKIHKIYLAVAVPLVTVTVFIPEFTVRDVNLYPWQIFTGPGIYIFSSFFLLTIIWTFRNLIGKYFISTGIEKMKVSFDLFPELERLYLLKEEVRNIYHECKENKNEARKRLNRAIEQLPEKEKKTLSKHSEEILNYFDQYTTNAFTEGVHTKFKLIKRISFGLRNPEIYVRKLTLAFVEPSLFV